jgi:hypothetical protein
LHYTINKMKKIHTYLSVLLLIMQLNLLGQELPGGICKIENGDLVFEIDMRWNKAQQKELRVQFDLDSSMVVGIYNGQKAFDIDGERWEVELIDRYHVKLFKPVQKRKSFGELLVNLLTGITDEGKNGARPGYVNGPVYFGFNDFSKPSVKQLEGGKVQFSLEGFKTAEKAFLAGSFNNWLTYDIPMKKTNTGWTVHVDLKPGKYYYKFIVDGQWIQDPANRKGEPDGVAGSNSVFFVTNHLFKLRGYTGAKSVIVGGSFNGWNQSNAEMKKTASGWELPVYLSYGTHTYKFKVDGEWILDPNNKEVVENEYGTGNSVVHVGDPAKFSLKGYEDAENVYLAGSFNGWKPNDIKMKKTASGWGGTYYIAPGNYEYKFIVDGKWIPDPDNPLTHGTGEFVNSFFIYKPNYTFVLNGYPNAKSVIVTGSFNGWIHHGYKMHKNNGQWELKLFLPNGKVSYKFIVDGEWIIDPNNPDYETNQYNTNNSVIWVD